MKKHFEGHAVADTHLGNAEIDAPKPTTLDEAEESRLITLCQQGDAGAFAGLYEMHAEKIYRRLQLLIGRTDADDALQTVFMVAARNIKTFRRESKFSTWLFGISTNVVRNFVRGKQRRGKAMLSFLFSKSDETQAITAEQEAHAEHNQKLRQLSHHLEGASEDQRVAFLLYYVEQLDLNEVAAQVNATQATTWARIEKAREIVTRGLERQQQAETRRLGKTP